MYGPRSPLADQVLCSYWFRPFTNDLLTPSRMQERFEATSQAATQMLAGFADDKLLEAVSMRDVTEPIYRVTPLGWTTREAVLRARGLRHRALLGKHSLEDLVVALLMSGHIENARHPGLLHASPDLAVDELGSYLPEHSLGDIEDACESLVAAGLIQRTTKLRRNGKLDLEHHPVVAITRAGRRSYEDQLLGRLGLGAEDSILDLVMDTSLRVFFSWQSEFPESRNLLKALVKRVIKTINAQSPVRPLELIQATALGDGAVRIDVQLMKLIKEAHLVVADVTPVAADHDRRRVNDNVLVEVGYALASKEPGQVLLLAMRRDDLAKGSVAFDIANVQRIEVAPDGKKDGRVQAEMEAMLRRKGWLH